MAGMIHAITLLVVLLAAAPLASYIPMAVLAAILFVVAYNMGEWHEIPQLLKLTKTDISVWIVTFALTVFADLTVAVEVGMILAAFLYIRRVSATTTVSMVTSDYIESGRAHSLQDKNIPSYVAIFRIHGPLLFGVTALDPATYALVAVLLVATAAVAGYLPARRVTRREQQFESRECVLGSEYGSP